jgi:hypothetical protein
LRREGENRGEGASPPLEASPPFIKNLPQLSFRRRPESSGGVKVVWIPGSSPKMTQGKKGEGEKGGEVLINIRFDKWNGIYLYF